MYLGVKLGLYRALSGRGSLTAAELAAETGLDGWYVREWLQSQATGGLILSAAGPARGLPHRRRCALPGGPDAVEAQARLRPGPATNPAHPIDTPHRQRLRSIQC